MKISLCTTTMNRLKFFSETIRKNVDDNSDHEDTEFIVLDYNSTDDTDEWAKDNLMDLIESGKLTYYRESTAKYFKPAHSRNMCMRLATGDVLCNVDSDNSTGPGFVSYLNDIFSKEHEQPKVIANSPYVFTADHVGSHGRIAIKRRDFHYWGGYCEEFIGWGEEDNDLNRRMLEQPLLFHRERIHWRFLNAINHGDDLRARYIDFSDLPHRSILDSISNKRKSRNLNKQKSKHDMKDQRFVRNYGKNWGGGTVEKNFSETIKLTNPWIAYI